MNKKANPTKTRQASRMPENSTFFEKVIPSLLIFMAVVTVGLILFALSVLLGIVSF
jgi:hypothetical protein